MRILSLRNVDPDEKSGSGYVIAGYQRGMEGRGHSVTSFAPSDWRATSIRRGRRFLEPPLMAVTVARQAALGGYDLIELWGGATWMCAGLLKARSWGPIVHRSNGIEQHRRAVEASVRTDRRLRPGPVPLSMYDLGLRWSDAIVTVSRFDAGFLLRTPRFARVPVRAVNNPLPTEFLGQRYQPRDTRVVGFCGSWIPRKGVETLVAAMTRFLRAFPAWIFSVVGARDVQGVGRAFPPELRARVRVLGPRTRDDLVEWYQRIEVLVAPSIYESFGLVVAEAMACGAAVVTTPVGFAHDLDDEREVALVRPGDARSLEAALRRLAEDQEQRRRIGQAGHARVQGLRWKPALDAVEELYTHLVSNSRPRS